MLRMILAAGALADQAVEVRVFNALADCSTSSLEFTTEARLEKLNAADDAGPSIFAALQEQLGLRLVPARAQGEILVIDHVERPSEN
jgi:uncharacterized protein (TIGR03435 family)